MTKPKSAILEAMHETAKGLHQAGVMDLDTLWIHLGEEQAIIFRTELEQLEAEKGMQYVTSVERLAKKEGSIAILGTLLAQRFGALPDWATQKLQAAAPETLESWARRIFDARSLEEIFA